MQNNNNNVVIYQNTPGCLWTYDLSSEAHEAFLEDRDLKFPINIQDTQIQKCVARISKSQANNKDPIAKDYLFQHQFALFCLRNDMENINLIVNKNKNDSKFQEMVRSGYMQEFVIQPESRVIEFFIQNNFIPSLICPLENSTFSTDLNILDLLITLNYIEPLRWILNNINKCYHLLIPSNQRNTEVLSQKQNASKRLMLALKMAMEFSALAIVDLLLDWFHEQELGKTEFAVSLEIFFHSNFQSVILVNLDGYGSQVRFPDVWLFDLIVRKHTWVFKTELPIILENLMIDTLQERDNLPLFVLSLQLGGGKALLTPNIIRAICFTTDVALLKWVHKTFQLDSTIMKAKRSSSPNGKSSLKVKEVSCDSSITAVIEGIYSQVQYLVSNNQQQKAQEYINTIGPTMLTYLFRECRVHLSVAEYMDSVPSYKIDYLFQIVHHYQIEESFRTVLANLLYSPLKLKEEQQKHKQRIYPLQLQCAEVLDEPLSVYPRPDANIIHCSDNKSYLQFPKVIAQLIVHALTGSIGQNFTEYENDSIPIVEAFRRCARK